MKMKRFMLTGVIATDVIVAAMFFMAKSPVFAETQANTSATTDSDQPLCLLQARVFDADGKEFQSPAAGTQVYVFLWKKIGDKESQGESVRGTTRNPVVHSPDGSSWRRIGEFYLRDPNWSLNWPVKKKVSPGEYRFSLTVHKIFTKWEGPPGTSEASSSAYYGRVINVDGYAAPKRIYGWGLGDVFTVGNGDTEKMVELRPDNGPKVRLRTTFFPDPATVSAKNAETEKEVLPQCYREAAGITMKIFREDNFPTDLSFESNQYGIPWFVDFDRMKPGRYYVHFYRGTTPPETATTAATDVFAFDVTENGPNDFVFSPEKSLAENAPWQVTGVVRDENGNPLPNVRVSLGTSVLSDSYSSWRMGEYVDSMTDAEGKYRLLVNPSPMQSGAVFDAKTNRWRWGFRLQQGTLRATPGYGDIPAFDSKADLIFLGEFATDELKQQLAERTEDMILVAMNKPAVVDFSISSQEMATSRMRDWREASADSERRKLRFEALERRKTFDDSDSQKLFREIVLPNSLNRDYVDAEAIGSKISVSLTTDKPAFMMDEPIELTWNIANGSDFDVSVMTDENMGNPTLVWAVSGDGDILLENECWFFAHSGPVKCERIRPKGSFPYKIFLPDKFAIPKPGRYTINVARNLSVQRIEPAKDERDSLFWSPNERWIGVIVPVIASTTIDVVPTDPVVLGKQIDELVKKIQDRNAPGKYEGAEKALKFLCAINDERVIPCLVGEIRENNYEFAFHAIDALSKFKSDAAFDGIKKALTLSDNNLLLVAASALADSRHPGAMAELLKNQDHPSYSVRLRVVQSAEKMDRETALEMLRKRFNDPGWEGNVGKEARRIYEELTVGKKTD
ncbi:MAG: carboxypeptidase-like regulatory domain-containing protein [Planctomycetaceae bacterium]|nr:carboxypeptidase-like regulatory domain-containing protein [Planctomycetaceae bacterium]